MLPDVAAGAPRRAPSYDNSCWNGGQKQIPEDVRGRSDGPQIPRRPESVAAATPKMINKITAKVMSATARKMPTAPRIVFGRMCIWDLAHLCRG